MKILFICNQNKHRSKTAEDLFKGRYQTKSAGLYNSTPVSAKEIAWADVVIVMEDFQRQELSKRFPSLCLRKQIISLSVADQYSYGQEELKEVLESRLKELLPSTHQTAS